MNRVLSISGRVVTIGVMGAMGIMSSMAITPQEAAEAILGRNGDRAGALLERQAKDLETLTLGNVPDPEVEGAYKFAPDGEPNRWSAELSYGFEWPGVYGARRAAGSAMLEANAAEEDAVTYEKRMEILREIGTYLYADRRLAVMRTMASATDSLADVTERAHKGGQMSRLDLCKVKLEQGRVKTQIANIEAEKRACEGNLQTLNGGFDCTHLLESIDRTWVMTPVHSLELYLQEAMEKPAVVKAIADYKTAKAQVKVTRSEGLPGFSVGYAHDFEDGMHFNGATLGVSIPLFSGRGKVKAAEAAESAAEYAMTVATDQAESEIRVMYDEVLALDRALEVPTEVFSSTDYNTLLLKAYRGGELTLTDYLTERAWFEEAQLDFMELQYQREQTMWMLSSLCN